nr:DUF4157 domain-containing protein [Haloterrigena salifodinae]
MTDDTERSAGGRRDRKRSSPSVRSSDRQPARSAEKRFGVDCYKDGLDTVLQRLANDHGPQQVREWADEGMPVDTMGKPRDMEQFRDRQRERPAAVPTDIERQNNKSVQRSRGAHNESANAGDTQVPDSVRDVISSPGQPLEASIQRAMEERMGDSLGDVQIHTGPQAANACEDINARAFTVGNHIAFNHGEYDPESAGGQHVLAHELAHVRQQTGAAVSMLPQDQDGDLEIDPDPRLEREAEETADRVMRGGKLGLFRMHKTEIHVQRMPDAEKLEKAREQIVGRPQDESESVEIPADPEVLAEEVQQLKNGQAQIMGTILTAKPGAPTDGGWGLVATKGVLGSLAGAGAGATIGAAAGSIVPGLGTVAGAAIGAGISGAASDLTKKGIEFMSSNRPGSESERLEDMYRDIQGMYRELKEGSEHDTSNKVDF